MGWQGIILALITLFRFDSGKAMLAIGCMIFFLSSMILAESRVSSNSGEMIRSRLLATSSGICGLFLAMISDSFLLLESVYQQWPTDKRQTGWVRRIRRQAIFAWQLSAILDRNFEKTGVKNPMIATIGIENTAVAIDCAVRLRFVADLRQIVCATGGWLIHRLDNGCLFRLTRLQWCWRYGACMAAYKQAIKVASVSVLE